MVSRVLFSLSLPPIPGPPIEPSESLGSIWPISVLFPLLYVHFYVFLACHSLGLRVAFSSLSPLQTVILQSTHSLTNQLARTSLELSCDKRLTKCFRVSSRNGKSREYLPERDRSFLSLWTLSSSLLLLRLFPILSTHIRGSQKTIEKLGGRSSGWNGERWESESVVLFVFLKKESA